MKNLLKIQALFLMCIIFFGCPKGNHQENKETNVFEVKSNSQLKLRLDKIGLSVKEKEKISINYEIRLNDETVIKASLDTNFNKEIVLFNIEPLISSRLMGELIQKFQQLREVSAVWSVAQHSSFNTSVLFQNTFAVLFKKELNRMEIDEINRSYSANILSKIGNDPNHYLLKAEGKTYISPLDIANQYLKHNDVLSAHPDYLIPDTLIKLAKRSGAGLSIAIGGGLLNAESPSDCKCCDYTFDGGYPGKIIKYTCSYMTCMAGTTCYCDNNRPDCR